jgi:hypothetical protein
VGDGGLGAVEIDVDDGGHVRAMDAGVQALDMVGAHATRADDGDAQVLSHS